MYRDPSPEEEPIQTELLAACFSGDLEQVAALVDRGAKVDVRGLDHSRGLSTALQSTMWAKRKRVEILEWLMAHGAPLEPVQDSLMASAIVFGAPDVVDLLKSRDVPVAPDGLVRACHFGKASSIRFALRVGCDPRGVERGSSKRTALHALAEREEKDAVEFATELLDAGVPIDLQDAYGRTALYVAAGEIAIETVGDRESGRGRGPDRAFGP